ncbi:hypothetical protein ACOKFD_08190 [Flagellimonas sp. S174]|uniref:hypothetical protein n=1 Tax=Flagellimonas sp. S174 TaxID=3410790 RepID=UPI003BF46835
MKTILLLVSLVFAGFAVGSCTNDEGETEFEILNPGEEDSGASLQSEEKVIS